MRRLRDGWAQTRAREVAFALGHCPFCGPSAFVRLRAHEIGVRCLRCRATAVHMSIGSVLHAHVSDLGTRDVYELSARGPLAAHLVRYARSVALSEYFTGMASGTTRDGVRCEDVQHLTYADASFDIITHTEVLEHVPDDKRAFAELRRVLRMIRWLAPRAFVTVERAERPLGALSGADSRFRRFPWAPLFPLSGVRK